jgi:hypothetical protein
LLASLIGFILAAADSPDSQSSTSPIAAVAAIAVIVVVGAAVILGRARRK